MPHAIGATVWHNGTPAVITTEPYTLYGGTWQDAKAESGRTITVPTPEWVAERDAKRRVAEDDARRRFATLSANITNFP